MLRCDIPSGPTILCSLFRCSSQDPLQNRGAGPLAESRARTYLLVVPPGIPPDARKYGFPNRIWSFTRGPAPCDGAFFLSDSNCLVSNRGLLRRCASPRPPFGPQSWLRGPAPSHVSLQQECCTCAQGRYASGSKSSLSTNLSNSANFSGTSKPPNSSTAIEIPPACGPELHLAV
jgi:hypothetical protein